MEKRGGLYHINKSVRDRDGRKLMETILHRKEPKGYRNFLNKFSAIKKNPNIGFRISVYDRLMTRAQNLVGIYGDNYEQIRKEIQKGSYKNLVELALGAGWGAATPSAFGVASAGKISIPHPKFGPGPLFALIPFIRQLGTGLEWRFYSRKRQVRKVFWMLLDQLSNDLTGQYNKTKIRNLLDYEATLQMQWDDAVAKTSLEKIKHIFQQPKVRQRRFVPKISDSLGPSTPKVEQGKQYKDGTVYFPKSKEWIFPPTKITLSKKSSRKKGLISKPSYFSQKKLSSIQKRSPLHKTHFSWKSNAIPPKHLQSKFRPNRPGQPGWGLEIHQTKGPSYSFIDPVKIAERTLRYGKKPIKPPINAKKPFISTIDRLKRIEKRSAEQIKTQQWLRKVNQELNKGIKYQTPVERRAMEKKYGVDLIAKTFTKPKPTSFSQLSLSQRARQEIMKKGVYVHGVWGTEIKRHHLRSTLKPPSFSQPKLSKQTQREIMKKGVYVHGVWGTEIKRSRSFSNPLRQMGRGLINPNRLK